MIGLVIMSGGLITTLMVVKLVGWNMDISHGILISPLEISREVAYGSLFELHSFCE